MRPSVRFGSIASFCRSAHEFPVFTRERTSSRPVGMSRMLPKAVTLSQILHHVIHPALHPQQDAANHGDRLPMVAVDGHLRYRAGRQAIACHVIGQIDTDHRPAGGVAAVLGIDQSPGDLQLARRHRVGKCRDHSP